MTPVFLGRIQTRIFVAIFVGIPWTLLISPFLYFDPPGPQGAGFVFTFDSMAGSESPIITTYKLTLAALAITTIFGCIFWEPVYHFLMQFRWEKDWPAFFQLLQVVPEGITTFLLLHIGALNPISTEDGNPFVPVLAYTFLFFTTWIILWLAANGPMKIFFIRWRFFGGRLI